MGDVDDAAAASLLFCVADVDDEPATAALLLSAILLLQLVESLLLCFVDYDDVLSNINMITVESAVLCCTV